MFMRWGMFIYRFRRAVAGLAVLIVLVAIGRCEISRRDTNLPRRAQQRDGRNHDEWKRHE